MIVNRKVNHHENAEQIFRFIIIINFFVTNIINIIYKNSYS